MEDGRDAHDPDVGRIRVPPVLGQCDRSPRCFSVCSVPPPLFLRVRFLIACLRTAERPGPPGLTRAGGRQRRTARPPARTRHLRSSAVFFLTLVRAVRRGWRAGCRHGRRSGDGLPGAAQRFAVRGNNCPLTSQDRR